jgi:hypothetical protein
MKTRLKRYNPIIPARIPLSSISSNVQKAHIRHYDKGPVIINRGNIRHVPRTIMDVIPRNVSEVAQASKPIPLIKLRPRISEAREEVERFVQTNPFDIIWANGRNPIERKEFTVQREALKYKSELTRSGRVALLGSLEEMFGGQKVWVVEDFGFRGRGRDEEARSATI